MITKWTLVKFLTSSSLIFHAQCFIYEYVLYYETYYDRGNVIIFDPMNLKRLKYKLPSDLAKKKFWSDGLTVQVDEKRFLFTHGEVLVLFEAHDHNDSVKMLYSDLNRNTICNNSVPHFSIGRDRERILTVCLYKPKNQVTNIFVESVLSYDLSDHHEKITSTLTLEKHSSDKTEWILRTAFKRNEFLYFVMQRNFASDNFTTKQSAIFIGRMAKISNFLTWAELFDPKSADYHLSSAAYVEIGNKSYLFVSSSKSQERIGIDVWPMKEIDDRLDEARFNCSQCKGLDARFLWSNIEKSCQMNQASACSDNLPAAKGFPNNLVFFYEEKVALKLRAFNLEFAEKVILLVQFFSDSYKVSFWRDEKANLEKIYDQTFENEKVFLFLENNWFIYSNKRRRFAPCQWYNCCQICSLHSKVGCVWNGKECHLSKVEKVVQCLKVSLTDLVKNIKPNQFAVYLNLTFIYSSDWLSNRFEVQVYLKSTGSRGKKYRSSYAKIEDNFAIYSEFSYIPNGTYEIFAQLIYYKFSNVLRPLIAESSDSLTIDFTDIEEDDNAGGMMFYNFIGAILVTVLIVIVLLLSAEPKVKQVNRKDRVRSFFKQARERGANISQTVRRAWSQSTRHFRRTEKKTPKPKT